MGFDLAAATCCNHSTALRKGAMIGLLVWWQEQIGGGLFSNCVACSTECDEGKFAAANSVHMHDAVADALRAACVCATAMVCACIYISLLR